MVESTEKKQKGTLINILDLPPAEGAKGVSFDPEVEYTFKVTDVTAREQKTEKDGHEKKFIVIDMQCTEQESQATIKQSFFHNAKVTINDEDKTKDSDVVKYARGIGYPVGIKKPFIFADVVKIGTVFTAHTKLQKDKKTDKETGYSEIDLMTVKGKLAGGKPQTTISVSKEDEEFIVTMASAYANKAELITGLRDAKRMDLINLMMSMDSQGKLKYK